MKVMIYAIRGTTRWWKYISEQMPTDGVCVISDSSEHVDISIKARFYKAFDDYSAIGVKESSLLDAETVGDVVRRCRVLRALEPSKAIAMVLAMADAFDETLQKFDPTIIVSFPVDRYVSDVLYRLAVQRGVHYVEYTASPLPGRAMFMSRGKLLRYKRQIDVEQAKELIRELVEPTFHPSYVKNARDFGLMKWIRIFLYFRARSAFFWFRSWVESDLLDLHYLDAQSWLPHKVKAKDGFFAKYLNKSWQLVSSKFPKEKIIVVGLTVFPEASIDYWISDPDLLDYEENIVALSKLMSNLGFCVLVKDHPQQFGFRQCGLLERLSNIKNVIVVPYDVPANQLLQLAGWNFTFTGTMGLQAALLGKNSIVCKNYYSNSEDFIEFSNPFEFFNLDEKVKGTNEIEDLELRQQRIIRMLEMGSFKCDFFSFLEFKASGAQDSSKQVAQILHRELLEYLSKAG